MLHLADWIAQEVAKDGKCSTGSLGVASNH
jgi:hypothetical protein